MKTESEHGDKPPESWLQCSWSPTLDVFQGHAPKPPPGTEKEGGSQVPGAPRSRVFTVTTGRGARAEEEFQEEGPSSPGQINKLEGLRG